MFYYDDVLFLAFFSNIVSDFLHSLFQYFTFAYDLHNYILPLHIKLLIGAVFTVIAS